MDSLVCLIRRLLANGKVGIAKTGDGITPLAFALAAGQTEMANLSGKPGGPNSIAWIEA